MTEQALPPKPIPAPASNGPWPPCLISVDDQGRFSHQGAPIIHPKVLTTIFESVVLKDGVYLLVTQEQTCQLEVADTFYVVSRVDWGDRAARISLNDGSQELLDPASLWIGPGEILYCRVKKGTFPARFTRAAYYQITSEVEESPEGFVLVQGGRRFPIAQKS